MARELNETLSVLFSFRPAADSLELYFVLFYGRLFGLFGLWNCFTYRDLYLSIQFRME